MYGSLPLGLKNVSDTFKPEMKVFLKFKRKFALLYLDDIPIFPEVPERNIYSDLLILTVLQDAGMILNPRKCEFLRIS